MAETDLISRQAAIEDMDDDRKRGKKNERLH